MTKRTANPLAKEAALTFNEWAGLQNGRIERLHFQRAAIQRNGTRFLMTGPSGEHSIDINESDLERTNAHWVQFATSPANLFENSAWGR